MTRARVVVALVAAIVVATLSAPAVARADAASGAALVAIVTAEPNAPVTRRVRAQLEGLGLDVIVLKPPAEGSTSRAPLEQAARNVGAVAAVRLVVSGEGKIEVWVADRVTGKAVVRELDPQTGGSDAAVATEAVELFRASLMELHSGEPPRGDVKRTPKIEALALPTVTPPPWSPRAAIAIGAAGEIAGAGTGPSLGIEIGAWVRLGDRWGLRALGRAPLAAAHAATATGSIDVASQTLGAMVSYELADPAAAWVPTIAVGAAALHVTSSGTATPPFVGATESAWRAAPVAGLGLAWSFARGLRLRADARGAWALPSLDIRTPQSTLGHWGAPSASLALAIEVLWSP